jgi:hypothetical protein
MTDAGPLPCHAPGLGLPPGAIAAPDGTVTLILTRPVKPSPAPQKGQEGGHPIAELKFRRINAVAWRKARTMKHAGFMMTAKSLGLPVAKLETLLASLCDSDVGVVADVVMWIVGATRRVPDRAVPLPTGGFTLPLLYPVSDGEAAHISLNFQPFAWQQLASLCQPDHDKFFASALHRTTGLSLRQASAVADRMDAADCAAVEAIVSELAKRAMAQRPNGRGGG